MAALAAHAVAGHCPRAAVPVAAVTFIAAIKKADLLVLREQLAKGKMKAVIDRRYPLSDVAAAFSYFAEGHAKGKIVLSL